MYSQRCPNCGQLISLKNDEVRAAVEETEANKFTHYDISCPKCRRTVKVPLKSLKLKMPRNVLPTEEPATEKAEDKPQ